MSFDYLTPQNRKGGVFAASNSQTKKNSSVLMMGWKPDEDTYAGDDSIQIQPKRVKTSVDGFPGFRTGSDGLSDRSGNLSGPRDTLIMDSELSVFTKPYANLNKRDFRILREQNNIKISYPFQSTFEFRVIRDWEESGLIREVRDNIARNLGHLRHPTPVQMQVIPVALKCKDIICTAPTGSGKTLAFLLPIINFLYFMPRIQPNKAHLGPYAVVMSPTRELVLQLAEVFDRAAAGLNLKSKVILGGRDKLDNLYQPAEIVFATVGRYNDLLTAKEASLEQCYYVVIDEADFMISKNLSEDLDSVLKSIDDFNNKPQDPTEAFKEEERMEKYEGLVRVTQLFSATMPDSLRQITDKYLKNPVNIVVEQNLAQMQQKKHFFEFLREGDEEIFGLKVKLLRLWLNKLDFKVIVFFNNKFEIDKCEGLLKGARLAISSYHSGLSQAEREEVMEQFKNGSVDVLLSTDLGGRGLDVEDVRSVVNFDGPKDFEQYIHRTGRTARAGKSGTCLTFFTKRDAHLFPELARLLEAGSQLIPDFLKPFVDQKASKNRNQVLVD